MASVRDSIAELRRLADRVMAEARSEGIESGGILGAWFEGHVLALSAVADLLNAQGTETAKVVARIEGAGKAAIEKVEHALNAGNKLAEQGERTLRQARLAQVAFAAEREDASERMAREMVPLLAERLQPSVARERPWDKEQRWFRYVIVGAAAVAIFLAGYGISSFRTDARVVAFNRCLSDAYTSGGHIYCRVDQFFAGSKPR